MNVAGRLAAAAAVVTLALGAPALAQPWQVAISPSAPTWRDRVQLTVSGTISGGCGASLAEPLVINLGPNRFRIEQAVWVDCVLPTGDFSPFTLSAELPPLEPGNYTLRVPAGTGALAELELTVYEVGTAALEVPPLSTDASPGSLLVALLVAGNAPRRRSPSTAPSSRWRWGRSSCRSRTAW